MSLQPTSEDIHERISLDVQIDPQRSELELEELRQGLKARPRRLPSKYFYDRRGAALFDQITRLPEYYQTRTERRLLEDSADEIARLTNAEELVELGAGSAAKTRVLLDAMQSAGRLRLYVPLDVNASEVQRVANELAGEYPELQIHGIVADFVHHLSVIPPGDPRLVILLGGTIGNFAPEDAIALLAGLSRRMSIGDYFLLGVDLIKDIDRLEAAYNDSAGVTARFNRNILRVINRVAGADFDPDSFEHRAIYSTEHARIEMYLVANTAHRVELARLDLTLAIDRGEALRTEISCKYDRSRVDSMLRAAGFQLRSWLADDQNLFALALARRR